MESQMPARIVDARCHKRMANITMYIGRKTTLPTASTLPWYYILLFGCKYTKKYVNQTMERQKITLFQHFFLDFFIFHMYNRYKVKWCKDDGLWGGRSYLLSNRLTVINPSNFVGSLQILPIQWANIRFIAINIIPAMPHSNSSTPLIAYQMLCMPRYE